MPQLVSGQRFKHEKPVKATIIALAAFIINDRLFFFAELIEVRPFNQIPLPLWLKLLVPLTLPSPPGLSSR